VLTNDDVASALERVADLLEVQGANAFRVRAYRAAAGSVRGWERPVAEIAEREGREGLDRLPAVGKSIAAAIQELCSRGRLAMLDRLEGEVSPEDLFATVPGIGEKLAHRVHDELAVETLEDLELAAHDGRLERVPGFGPRKTRAIRDTLATMLSRSARRRARHARILEAEAHRAPAGDQSGGSATVPQDERPSVTTLLTVDAEYRERAAANELRKIAPRRFNPDHVAWLPVLHVERDGWHFTALFSNTARAHELGTTRDWVILYYERDGHESQCTVVTERRGDLAGRRVVRGREDECRASPSQ
jgi:DNA polymerase (family 10)